MGKERPKSPVSTGASEWYDVLRYQVVPPAFLLFFTAAVQYLAWKGRGEMNKLTTEIFWDTFRGNCFSWKVVGVVYAWAYISLMIPSAQTKGPVTDYGQVPVYQDNGVLFFFSSIVSYSVYHFAVDSDISEKIYEHFPYILGGLNTSALAFCALLLIKGRYFPDFKEKVVIRRFPIAYEFYAGKELHPRLLGVDVKQFAICRIGMITWQIFMLAFYFVTVKRHEEAGLEFNHACLVSVLLQTIYIAKFWLWEAGYFWTLDVINDRAGYYLCWGCIVWMPALFTFPTYFFILHVPKLSAAAAWIIFVVGLVATALQYKVDKEKEEFRKTDGNCMIWGSKAKYLPVEYVDQQGKVKKSKLLISGFWGTLRHFNYTFEVVISFCWCSVAGFEYGLPPFYYAIFIAALVAHRIFRDEEKCSRKYGRYWDEYCRIVRYRMIPYVF